MAKGAPATLDDLLKQSKTTNRLLASQLRGAMSQTDLIGLVSGLGLSAQETAEIVGTTAGTVGVAQRRLKGKKKRTHRKEHR